MQLSPLQSRLAASVIASCLLVALYFTLFSPHFALAAELKEALPVLLGDFDFDLAADQPERSPLDPVYEPEFPAFDRGIVGRATQLAMALTNNEAMPLNVDAGTTQLFSFAVPKLPARDEGRHSLELRDRHEAPEERNLGPNALERDASLEARDAQAQAQTLERRQSSRTVYISVNTCLQPQPVDPSKTTMDPPQLTLFVSTSASNQSPGPRGDPSSQVAVTFTEGAAMYNVTTPSDEIYLGVYAPNVSSAFSGTYNFQIAASTDGSVFSYSVDQDAGLILVDSDYQGALLMTHNLTDSTDPTAQQQIMNSQPYVMFAQNTKDRSINGLQYSYCGLQNYAQIAATKNGQFASMVTTGMTKRGPGSLPKQEFYFSGLNSSSEYVGILARTSNSSGTDSVLSGGHVFRATSFETNPDHGNCAIIRNLTFCDQVAYSVPSNPNKFGNATVLGQFYDNYAATMYANFNKSLAQIPCEAVSSQRYSLATNCSLCAAAYKEWLCSVTIPRCEDFSHDAAYLHPRALVQPFPNGDVLDQEALAAVHFENTSAFNSSRNPMIDQFVQPGPYKEVLPCEDLCYKLAQSCPAAMGFGCPLPGDPSFASSYGQRSSNLSCNYQGSAHLRSAAVPAPPISWALLGGAFVGGLSFVFL
ncbi:stretch-activated Ca-permeable channel [Lasiosphaeria miniovina]|uniref:Stretch-activated Ca-permeable channel n=1 Tax=Lasiosphaeria miniovina TaxID=1954250 RepID=A0AA40E8J2_9PEZI|nr:stretch-activated Ca-permeable channel [Lasiosphaeria miniovina]KAK0727956.1 stretch-activated Ca-permeable channel [Lasiosphaeria miniovina]